MNAETRSRLLAETRRAARHDAESRTSFDRRRPPRPGDVFVIEQPGDFAVEWVILAHHPRDGRRVLAVPADGNELAGSGDVTVPDSASFGPLTVRCRQAAGWLDAGVFPGEARVGVLDAADVGRALRTWSRLQDGTLAVSRRAGEVDDDPDYRDWVEVVVEPARRDLVERSAS